MLSEVILRQLSVAIQLTNSKLTISCFNVFYMKLMNEQRIGIDFSLERVNTERRFPETPGSYLEI